MTETYNKFISNKPLSQADKKAMGCTISALALIVAGEEVLLPSGIKGWLDGKLTLSGSIKDNNYRDFVNCVRNAIKNGKPVAVHPYFAPNLRLLQINRPSSRLEKFYSDEYAPETFNMDAYIRLTCDTTESGKIIGLKQSVLTGEDSQKESLNTAFDAFFNKVKTYNPDHQK